MFKTKREKYAYVQGIKKGKRGGDLYRKGPPAKKSLHPKSTKSDDFWDEFFNDAMNKSRRKKG